MALDQTWLSTLATTIDAMGYEFVGAEQVGSLVRLYIDKPGGVTIDDCTTVSRQARAIMLVEGASDRGYRLEVSSPGIDRPLFTLDHYEKYVGSKVKMKLSGMPQKQLQGIIKKVEGETIYIEVDDAQGLVNVAFANVVKGHLVVDLDRKVGV